MPALKDEDERAAYYLEETMRPRAAAILWAALIERRLDSLFEVALRPDKAVHNELFQPSGPLGNFATKVRLAYLLGWIADDFYHDLLILGKIRNKFAHSIETADFNDQRIGAWLKSMKCYHILPGLVEAAKQRAKENPDRHNMAYAYTMEHSFKEPVSAFRLCVDLMLHQLDKYKENMERNLAPLKHHWMTADSAPEPSSGKS